MYFGDTEWRYGHSWWGRCEEGRLDWPVGPFPSATKSVLCDRKPAANRRSIIGLTMTTTPRICHVSRLPVNDSVRASADERHSVAVSQPKFRLCRGSDNFRENAELPFKARVSFKYWTWACRHYGSSGCYMQILRKCISSPITADCVLYLLWSRK